MICMFFGDKTFDTSLKVHWAFRNLIFTITETSKSELLYWGHYQKKGKEPPLHWEIGGM